MDSSKISRRLLKRLPIYLNYLKSLPDEDQNISATTIATALGLGQVQVRKDLAKVAHQGRCRTGRSREQLIRDIESYVNFITETTAIIIGSGAPGQCLPDCADFEKAGVNIIAGFDPQLTLSRAEAGITVYPISRLSTFCKYYDVRIAIVAVAQEATQAVCDELVESGIRVIWNFTPAALKLPQGIVVHSKSLTAGPATMWAAREEFGRGA